MPSTRVLVVGVCNAGKTTLVTALRGLGYDAYCVAQEHSLVPRLWALRLPDLVVYLDVSYEMARRRRKVYWGPERLEKQRALLSSAQARADLCLDTSELTPEQVLAAVLLLMRERGVAGGPGHAGHGQTER